jgi:hypothetical protein
MVETRTVEVADIEPFRARLIRFWQANLAPAYSDARFDWLYRQNPVGPTRTWLALDPDQEIKGCGSIYSWTYFHQGEPIRLGIAVDFAVDRSCRVFGPAFAIQRGVASACGEGGFDVIFVAPNPKAIGVFRKVGFVDVGRAREWACLLRTRSALEKVTRSARLARLLSPLADSVLRLLLWARGRPGYGAVREEIASACPPALSELWQREKGSRAFTPDKSAPIMDWYFAVDWYYVADGSDRYRYFCVFGKQDGELRGCVVFKRTLGNVEVKEVFPAGGPHVRAVLWRFVRAMAREDGRAIVLTFLGDPSFERVLRGLGFFPRKEAHRDYLMCFTPDAARKYRNVLARRDGVFLFFA